MFRKKFSIVIAFSFSSLVSSHYTIPDLIVGGTNTGYWVNVKKTNNFDSQAPVTDVTSIDLRCYTSQSNAVASTATVEAGSTIGIQADGPIYHPGVINVYMAKAPENNVASWDGDGAVWFKVFEISAVTDGGDHHLPWDSFAIPKNLPDGQYLVRTEQIALHAASTFGGGKKFIINKDNPLDCTQINVTNGGSGTPGPLGPFLELGILINIYYHE
ncbi:glycoside hydrolase family 61 protein [Gymnopilus junonius]|uniref:lytic cellulose monooxygenase (C4-dehydrogenating) n=1 Tax=Gymnopilus junonius TaxID=109634 RepID=A0A9P5NU41_GYMJU|nr:glycoside hydrolase family 61 protein [Gymnopilus junonius]